MVYKYIVHGSTWCFPGLLLDPKVGVLWNDGTTWTLRAFAANAQGFFWMNKELYFLGVVLRYLRWSFYGLQSQQECLGLFLRCFLLRIAIPTSLFGFVLKARFCMDYNNPLRILPGDSSPLNHYHLGVNTFGSLSPSIMTEQIQVFGTNKLVYQNGGKMNV